MAKKNKLSQLEVDYMFLRWGFMDGITKPIAEVAKKLKIDIKKALKIESKILKLIAEKGIK
jgi:DNA-directed RNA polymerase sigma subunit (sigma70/sigma32)